MVPFAKNTSVSVERTRAEIEITLKRYGASAFGYMLRDTKSIIGFEYNQKSIRFELVMPDLQEFEYSPGGRWRGQKAIQQAYEQACKQRWRALLLAIKAKLEAVESGIATFETEFLSYIVTPSGRTVGEELLPQIETMAGSGKVPTLLMLGKPGGH